MIHRKITTAVLGLFVAVAAHGAPAAPAPRDLVAGRRALDHAVAFGTQQELLGIRARFAALATAAPKSAWAHYWIAVCDWRATPRFDAGSRALARKTCEEGIEEIDRAIALRPAEGEFHALRSNLLGMSLQFHPDAMMTLGPQIMTEMQQALTASPDNPRVQLLNAINTLNKPAFVGGGPDKALPQFRQAQARFASTASADSTAPAWGEDDAWLWCGRTAMQLGDAATARTCYLKTLELTPAHRWVTQALLPEAERALADSSAKRDTAADSK